MKPIILISVLAIGTTAPGEVVHGTLVDGAGKPLAGVRLTGYAVVREEGRPSIKDFKVVTAPDGQFTLRDAPSLPTATVPVLLMAKLSDGRFAPVRLEANDGRAVWPSGSTATLTLKALDPSGKPIAGAKAELRDALVFDRSGAANAERVRYFASLRDGGRQINTNAEGIARFEGLPVGARAQYNVVRDGLLADGGAVLVGQDGVEQTVTLAQGVIVSGRVLQGGKPVPGVEVVASSLANHTMRDARAKTDANGEYRIANAYPGRVTLSANLGKLDKEWVAIAPDSINLAVGQERNGLNLVLDHGVVLTGQVLTKDARKPVAKAQVNVIADGGGVDRLTSDNQGRFSARVAPGEFYVSIDEIGSQRLGQQVYLRATVDAAHNPALELRVPDAAMMKPISHFGGLVTDAGGKPVADATVLELDDRTSAKSDDSGHFAFDHPMKPGDVVVALKGDAMSRRATQILDKPTVILALDGKATTVRGVLTDDDGKPLPGVEVTLGAHLGDGYVAGSATTTDANGAYRFDGLYGGVDSFFLWAKKKGYGPVTIQPIKTVPGDQKTLETMAMALADGTIDGQVLDPDGKPAAGVIVSSQVTDVPEVQTDSQGHFHLVGVPRGKHYLIASRSNRFGSGAEGVTGQTDVVIQLKPDSKPVPGLVSGNKTGMVAPALTIASWTNNGPVDLKALHGKIVVVDLWAVWCGPCVTSLPDMQKLHAKYASRGVVVIGIHAPGTAKEKVTSFVKERGLTYPVALDVAEDAGVGVTAKAFGLAGIPHMLVIDAKGKVAADTSEVDDVERAVRKLLGDE
jgi:thiol-disulfide isomerase/thioredoxin/protocatechuate 3,4-dioxygenase beta subunit